MIFGHNESKIEFLLKIYEISFGSKLNHSMEFFQITVEYVSKASRFLEKSIHRVTQPDISLDDEDDMDLMDDQVGFWPIFGSKIFLS